MISPSSTIDKLFSILVWTACGDSIVRAFDAKSGAIKRQFVGHEAAVNCMMLTGGKLYSGSSDGTLRVWDAKDVSDEMMQDDGPPPPNPAEVADADAAIVADTEDAPAEESEAVPEEAPEGEVVEDLENPEEAQEGDAEAPAEGRVEDGDSFNELLERWNNEVLAMSDSHGEEES